MSRGSGRIERAIRAAMRSKVDNALTVRELCERIYLSCLPPEKKHRVAVLRAMHRLAEVTKEFGVVQRHGVGAVLYHPDRPRSYKMAVAKLNAQPRCRRLWLNRELYDRPVSSLDLEEQLRSELSGAGDHQTT